MMFTRELRVLLLQDEPTDAELIQHALREAGLVFVAKRVDARDEFIEALDQFKPDVLLADWKLPGYNGLSAIKFVRNIDPYLPIIIVTGVIGDDESAGLIRAGANDYILKDRLARLPSAVQRAVTEAEGRCERKRIEKALSESEANLRESLRSKIIALNDISEHKDEFIATLAHELRNPLAALRSAFYILCDGASLNESHARAAEIVERQLSHLIRLVDDLLDFSRINAGKIELQRQQLDLSQLIRQVVDSCGELIHQRDHRLELRGSNEPLIINGDGVRLSQVFANLVTNAANYTPSGGHIEILAERNQSAVFISVKDNGVGIDSAKLGAVFDSFVQLHPHSPKGDSLGLGLSLVRKIVELHGGGVKAQSAGEGCGSNFIVRLPD